MHDPTYPLLSIRLFDTLNLFLKLFRRLQIGHISRNKDIFIYFCSRYYIGGCGSGCGLQTLGSDRSLPPNPKAASPPNSMVWWCWPLWNPGVRRYGLLPKPEVWRLPTPPNPGVWRYPALPNPRVRRCGSLLNSRFQKRPTLPNSRVRRRPAPLNHGVRWRCSKAMGQGQNPCLVAVVEVVGPCLE